MDIEQIKSELELRKPSHCPKCNSNRIARIAYGITANTLDGESPEDVVAGGCVITPDSPLWRCKDCKWPIRESEKNQDFISSLKEKIARNITDIESRDDLSAEEKSNRIIHVFSATCAGVAVQPIPFADIFVLTTIQAYMAERLAAVRGVPMAKGSAMELLTDLAKVIGLGMVAQQVALGLYKVGLPFLAGFTTIPLVYGLTYGIGKVLDYLFLERAKGNKLSPEEIKDAWNKARKEGKAKGKEYRKSMKEHEEKT